MKKTALKIIFPMLIIVGCMYFFMQSPTKGDKTEKIKEQKEIIHVDLPNGWSKMVVNNDMEENLKANLQKVDKDLAADIDEFPVKEQILFYYRQSEDDLEKILPEIKCILVPSNFKPDLINQTILMMKDYGANVITEPITDEILGKKSWQYALELPGLYKVFSYYIVEDGYYYILSFIDIPDYNNNSIFEKALQSISFKKIEQK
tara:strand:+ start:1468 stop:2079 length:612 start_codon:yes stop_codon:yes gene_type:complete